MVPSPKWFKISTHARRLETNTFTSLTNSQLDRSTDNTTFGRSFRLTFTNKEAAFRTKSVSALVASKAAFMPLPANSIDNDVVKDMLLTAHTTGSSTARVAIETPGKPIPLDKWGG